MGQIVSIAAALVGVATVTVVLSSPNTASIIKAAGSAFSGALSASEGH